MALRTKTIEYSFPTNTSALAAATRFDFAALTLFIPETASRTFRSVIVQVTVRDTSTAAASLTSWLIGIKLGAAAFSDVTVTDTITNTGEQQGLVFTRDVASYFNTNFGTGTSQTCQVGVQFGGLGTINITAKLIITYEYDDAAATTRIKTVRIPLESFTGDLTAALTEMGTNQIPNLNTFLPEASKVYRDIFFEVFANEANTGTTDFQLALALDAEAEALDGFHKQALDSAVWYYYIWKRTDMSPSSTHQFKARSTVAGRFNTLGVVLVVTYEYDHVASTSIMNSIMIPMAQEGGFGGTTAADRTRIQKKFMIEEPSPIALAQSGILLRFDTNAVISGIGVAAGGQVPRSYTHTLGSIPCGQYTLVQRVDSGSSQGVGISIARGENTFTLDAFWTDAVGAGIMVGAVLYLNYTSGKHASGDAVHNHTTYWSIGDMAADALLRELPAFAPNIPEEDYWITALGFEILCLRGTEGCHVTLMAELLAGEGPTEAWKTVYSDGPLSASELGIATHFQDATAIFDQHPNEQDSTRLAVKLARKYRVVLTSSLRTSTWMLLTYHAIAKSVAWYVTGFTGNGARIAVEVFRTNTDEKVQGAKTLVDESYSVVWQNDVTLRPG